MTAPLQLTADYADLTEWAIQHGPDYLRYAAKHGYTVKSGTMDYLCEKIAVLLDGRLMRDDLVLWKPREHAAPEWVTKWEALVTRLEAWHASRSLPDVPLPPQVTFEPLTVLRIEEQPDPTDPNRILKYTGTVVRVRHPATSDRLVLLNFEAAL